jgi:phosphate acetyltransferase
MPVPESARIFMAGQIERVRRRREKKTIVFPEGSDARVIEAAGRLAREGLVRPILIGRPSAGAPEGVAFVDPNTSPKLDRYAALLHERRRAKGLMYLEAMELARQPLYFASLMVAAGDADGGIGGCANSTADTVRAALHAIGVKPKVKVVSSVFILACQNRQRGHNGLLAMADCAIVIDPSSLELAEIAIATADSARTLLDTEPIVAMLSFSTKGSGRHAQVDRVVEAVKILHARAPEMIVDGELQADAALDPVVAKLKAPGSPVAGRANTLIFPDLGSANIAYKMVERLGDAAAIGPFLQGLAKPVNDLSRGATAEEIYDVAIITSLQAQAAAEQGAGG